MKYVFVRSTLRAKARVYCGTPNADLKVGTTQKYAATHLRKYFGAKQAAEKVWNVLAARTKSARNIKDEGFIGTT